MIEPLERVRRWRRAIALQVQRFVRKPPLVDFVIIGAEKAGTTLLQNVLRDAPSVSMPENEVRYFRDPFFADANLLNDAISMFSNDQCVGIKHPSYLGCDNVAERLHAYNPNLRIVVSLRDPVDRAVSAYYHYLSRGQISLRKPDEAFSKILSGDRTDDPKYADILSFGCYHTHLQRYFDVFPDKQILVLEYERLSQDHQTWQRLFDFLKISDPTPSEIPQCNVGSYDWEKCVSRHFFHKLTCLHDSEMNLIDFRPDEKIEPQLAVERFTSTITQLDRDDSPTTLSDEMIAKLVEAYQPEMEQLVAAGWLTPQDWRHFPSM